MSQADSPIPELLAPIAIFGYNRPNHLKRCLESLQNNKEAISSDVYIFLDGPKSNSEVSRVEATRAVAKLPYRFGKIIITEQEENLGLGKSILSGIDTVLAENPKIIVLEDDLEVTSHFLKYMNQGLAIYESEKKVASIHGYNYQFTNAIDEPYFIRGADCLGWATWADRWRLFNKNSQDLYQTLLSENLLSDFDLDGAFAYSKSLNDEAKNGFHSWAIHWHATAFVNNLLTLYPGKSLVKYNGADGSGTHFAINEKIWETEISQKSNWVFPAEFEESQVGRIELIGYFNRIYPKLNLPMRVIRKLKSTLQVLSLNIGNLWRRVLSA
jgi:glycosyltransferase involved in cell wall biosynthesis